MYCFFGKLCVHVFVIGLPYRYLEGVVNKVAEQRLIK